MGTLGWPQILIIAAVIILLFGARKLPDLARGLGSSLRIFRAETKGMMDDDKASSDNTGASNDTTAASTEQPRAVESRSDTSAESVPNPAGEGAADQASQTRRDS